MNIERVAADLMKIARAMEAADGSVKTINGIKVWVPENVRPDINLEKAIAVGSSKTKLRKELNEARSMLKSQYNKSFGKGVFDFDKKTLTSDDGRLKLVWSVRSNPLRPDSYNNQQTSVGSIRIASKTI